MKTFDGFSGGRALFFSVAAGAAAVKVMEEDGVKQTAARQIGCLFVCAGVRFYFSFQALEGGK